MIGWQIGLMSTNQTAETTTRMSPEEIAGALRRIYEIDPGFVTEIEADIRATDKRLAERGQPARD